MQNGFTHFLFGNMQTDSKKLSETIQIMKGIFSAKYWWAIALLICLNSLSFAQTNSEGATPAMTKAGAPAGSYALSGFENVNLFNGNLNFNLPLVKIGGRGKAQSSVNLAINSARWNAQLDPNDTRNSNPGVVKNTTNQFRENVSLDDAHRQCARHLNTHYGDNLPDFEGYRDCMAEISELGEIIQDYDLARTQLMTAPGSYYRTYTITESNREVPGYSPGVMVARVGKFFKTTLVRLFFTAADGTEYELRDALRDGQPYAQTAGGTYSRGQVFVSPDGAGLRFVSTIDIKDDQVSYDQDDRISGTLYFPDGTIYEIDNGNVVLIKDVNGNQIIYTYSGNKVVNILDSLGRQVRFRYDNEILSNDPAYDPNDAFLKYDKIETQLNSEDWQVIKVYRTKLGKALRSDFPNALSGSALFPEFTGVTFGLYDPEGVVKRVELPDGRTYKLFYTPYNEVARVVLPTGGAYEYDFPMPPPPGSGEPSRTIFRPVKERRVYADGGSVVNNSNYNSKQKYVRHAPLGTYPNHDSKVTVEEYSGNVNSSDPNDLPRVFKSDHYFYGLPDSISHTFYPKWNEGREYKTETFDSTTTLTDYGQLRQRTFTEWKDATQATWGVVKKIQVDSVTSTVFENGKSLTGKTTYRYDNDSLLNNKTDEYIYDYAAGTASTIGTPIKKLKHSKIYYLTVNPSNSLDYTSDSIFLHGLPRITELYEVKPDNTEVLISKSEIKYDEAAYSILPGGGIPVGWTNPGSTTPRGNATTNIAYNISQNDTLATHTQFDEFGNPRKAWDANNANNFNNPTSEIEYSAAYGFAFPTRTISAAPGANDNFGTTQKFESKTDYDYYTGLPLAVTNENDLTTANDNLTTRSEYNDDLLRPTRVIAPNGQQTIFEYGDASGDLYAKVKKQIDQTNWTEATEYFDGLGRKTKTRTKETAGDIFTETEYDNMGRVKRVTNPYREGETKLWSETRYDALGRLVETFAPKATGSGDSTGVTSYDLATYDTNALGTVVIGTDASGRKSRSITNALGQLIRVDEPVSTGGTVDGDLGALATPHQPTSYKYDALGKMIEVTQGNPSQPAQPIQRRYFLYDTLGRLLRVRQPEQEVNTALNLSGHPTNSQWTAGFSYDNNGNVLTTTDAKGTTITNTYDMLNRVKTRTYSGETGGQQTPTVYYTYDGKYYGAQGEPFQAAGSSKGALTQVRNGISTSQTVAFDVYGKSLTYQQITDGVTYAIDYTYTLLGTLETQTYPHGRVVRNVFDQDGDLSKVESKKAGATAFTPFASNFAYTAAGGISQMKLGNGKWETAKFNDRLQVRELSLGNSATDTSVWKVNYEYGELNDDSTVNQTKNTGNIAKQTISFAGLAQPFVQTYKYDSLYRLKEARETTNGSQNWIQGFDYDRFGNRTSFNHNVGGLQNGYTPGIDQTTNRFNLNQGFGYDKNGNVISDVIGSQARSFTFNGENKQTEIRDPSITPPSNNLDANLIGRYLYDGEGKRVKKVTATETTVFVYSGGKLIAEYSTKLADHPSINYTTSDHLDTPRLITDELGQVKSRRDYMPFGEDLISGIGGRTGDAGQKYAASKDEVRQKFTGYQKDAETNLDFAEARMYNNSYGRFTAIDPLLASGKSANPQTFNRYAYVGNNPILRVDVDGKIWGISGAKVKWFKSEGKLVNAGFSVFRPNNWTYQGVGNTTVKLNPRTGGFRVIPNGPSGEYKTKPQTTELDSSQKQLINSLAENGTRKFNTAALVIGGGAAGTAAVTGCVFLCGPALAGIGTGATWIGTSATAAGGALAELTATALSNPFGQRAAAFAGGYALGMFSSALDPYAGGGGVEKIGGRNPINSQYAGQTYPLENLSSDLAAKYPNSVQFNSAGFPDFSPYARETVQIPNLRGDTYYDFMAANDAAGLTNTPDGYTWHHHQNGVTMQLVPSDLHNAVRHTGGAATIRHR